MASITRRPKADLSPEQRSAIIQALEAGQKAPALAKQFNCSPNTIRYTFKRFQQHSTVDSLPKSGRPPIFDDRATRSICRLARTNPHWSYKELCANHSLRPSRSTARRYVLKELRGKRKIPISKPLAKERVKVARKGRSKRVYNSAANRRPL